jgi:ATP-dependent metalloprotease FtsH
MGVLGVFAYLVMNTKQEEKKGSGGSSFPISPAHSQVKNVNVRFTDVKGCDEVKQELVEVVEYLKNPSKFTQLGARLPKGILLSGPPGTGKTLLARAIAGEAGVSFLYCSGSSFDELFVGVGPKRVRTLFEDAKKQAPCIIFIDEIDAVGVKRSKFSMSVSKESTLNQLLTEMDGFNQTSGIIVVGATNLPESLDSALTRPGRFDKMIHVPLPDVKGRKDIIELYLKKTVPGPDVDSKILARGTPGFSGAELANLINLAAIKATVQNKPHIDMRTLEEARDDVIVGIKRVQEQREEDRRLTAYHEGGHALVSLLTDGSRPLHKATIIGRGSALGITWSLGGDEVSRTKKETMAAIAQAMGGRAAEELIFGEEEVTTGASSDIMSATRLATAMVTQWGMSDRVGKVYYDISNGPSGGLKISDEEMNVISSEIKDIIDERYLYAKKMLKDNEDALHRIAEGLLKYETLTGEEIRRLAQGRSIDRDL